MDHTATAVDLIGFVIGWNSAEGSRDNNIIILLLYYSTTVIGLKRIENDIVLGETYCRREQIHFEFSV